MTTAPDRTPAPARVPAPDLARGFMLLLIVLANSAFYLYAAPSTGGTHPAPESVADRIVQALLIVTMDLRVYPMFAVLFGYGLVMILRSQQAKGATERQARRTIQRRNLWLILFGAAHALLLWGGDILGAYGLTGLLIVWLFLRRRDVTLLVWAAIGMAAMLVTSAFSVLGGLAVMSGEVPEDDTGQWLFDLIDQSVASEGYVAAAGARMTLWAIQTVASQGPLGIAVPVAILVGMWAARHRVLERPGEHRTLLWTVAVVGVVVGWLGGLPQALAQTGVVASLEPAQPALAAPQMATGVLCGVAYVAVFGLIGEVYSRRGLGPVARAVSAVGKRSMTCYLAQSVLCAPVLAAWGVGLGAHLDSATMAAYAVAVWLVTVAYAMALERAGRPGPAEQLMRVLVHGRSRPFATPAASSEIGTGSL